MSYDFVKLAEELEDFRLRFCLSPKQWAACTYTSQLQWRSVPFKKAERIKVPKSRGLYAFVVRPNVAAVFEHGYLVYIGQTGHITNRTLNDRFDDYFQPSQIRKRPKLAWMMSKWQDHLLFYYVDLDATPDLKVIETGLNDALLPPFVTGDFSPKIRRAVKAFP